MPTYTKIEFIRNFEENELIGNIKDKKLMTKVIHKAGAKCQMHIRRATYFVQNSYAVYL